MNLTNKTILITGGSEGLGFALAKELLSHNSEVIICGRNSEKLNDASKKLNSNKLRTFVCDVSDYNQVQMMVKNITNLDILINNAGIFMESPIE
ncbi:MAG TPA: SDR family NAD(P)-dependent oxidoreductase, partial [Candidatus Dojkabacteria bacterium]|nr:SDR family NAD(P)-dependent oxidoreductase [Candidatus Dojkabacteria bacterium]